MVRVQRQPSGAWPQVQFEEHEWVPGVDVPRRWRSTYSGPYRSAVVPRIAELYPEVPSGVAAVADEASAEIARFDAEMGREIAPFASVLLRSESAASSQIEHITASAKAVALAELGDDTRRNASLIVANTHAMSAAVDLADRLDGQSIIDMHATLLHRQPNMIGQWRTKQVWIGRSGHGPHTAEFVPPHHARVPEAIDDLVAFMERDDIPVLAQAGIAHAQFETIHPFPDGNGRAGRALVHAMLRSKGLTRQVTVPVSAGLLSDIDAYFAALGAYRQGDVGSIVERFAEASYVATANGRSLVQELRDIKAEWSGAITARRQAVVWRVLDVVLRQPVFDSPFLQRALGVSAPGADAAISQLVNIGAVEQLAAGRRNRRYAAPAVLEALDAFAERAGRRQHSL